MTVLRRQAASAGSSSGGDDEQGAGDPRHCCRGARFHEPGDPAREVSPRVHATGAIGPHAMTGHAIMRQTGHRSPVLLEVYAREHAPLVGNAVTRLNF